MASNILFAPAESDRVRTWFTLKRLERKLEAPMRLRERLDRIESLLTVLVERAQTREWYTTEEFARIVGRTEFTVREWCRHQRIRAEKKASGRGAYAAWVISHEELLRYQKEGLLPLPSPSYIRDRVRNRS
jgi:hypothetical protein